LAAPGSHEKKKKKQICDGKHVTKKNFFTFPFFSLFTNVQSDSFHGDVGSHLFFQQLQISPFHADKINFSGCAACVTLGDQLPF
jgi:hypothetical protein